jgi:hypothetical protein
VAANLERRQIGEQFKILDPARLPERPTSPESPAAAVHGAVAAFGFGLSLDGVHRSISTRPSSPRVDVTAALNLLVLAASVPLPKWAYASRAVGSHR